MRCSLIALAGRPNAGKSTLLNHLCGHKISIVSDKPQTTRFAVRGVRNENQTQMVFVDTPGLHKPVTALGESVNTSALGALEDVDAVCLVLDATAAFGSGDRWVAEQLPSAASGKMVVVVNKVDIATRAQVLKMLTVVGELGASAYFPVSAMTGDGLDVLLRHLLDASPEGPWLFPDDMVTDLPEDVWMAELVREQLLLVTRDELPYSIATRVVENDGRRVRVEIIVERESQKGMVIGKGGSILKDVGTRARAHLPEGTFLELVVKVDKDWQRRPDRVSRLGY
jgi:GTPase